MPGIPRVAQIGGLFGARLLPMTGAAQCVQLGSIHPSRVSRMNRARIRRMRRRRPVTHLAMHAQLPRHDSLVFRQLQVSRRVAGEASHHARSWIEGPEGDSRVSLVARCRREGIRSAVPRFAQLHIMFGIQAADKGNSLVPRAECPLSRLVFRRPRQRARMAGKRLGLVLRNVASPARL